MLNSHAEWQILGSYHSPRPFIRCHTMPCSGSMPPPLADLPSGSAVWIHASWQPHHAASSPRKVPRSDQRFVPQYYAANLINLPSAINIAFFIALVFPLYSARLGALAPSPKMWGKKEKQSKGVREQPRTRPLLPLFQRTRLT